MPRIEFEADTIDELVAMAGRWIAGGPDRDLGSGRRHVEPEDLVGVLRRIKSSASRGILKDVAVASLADTAWVRDQGAPVGVLGVINRTARRRAHRDLLIWDVVAGGYRMDAADAQIVLDVLGRPAQT